MGTSKVRTAFGVGLVAISALGCDKFYGMTGKRTTPPAAAAEATTGAPASSVAQRPRPARLPLRMTFQPVARLSRTTWTWPTERAARWRQLARWWRRQRCPRRSVA